MVGKRGRGRTGSRVGEGKGGEEGKGKNRQQSRGREVGRWWQGVGNAI